MLFDIEIILKVFSYGLFTGIILTYGLAGYWELKYLIASKKYLFTKVYRVISVFLISILYGYISIQTLLGIEQDNFLSFGWPIFVRPCLAFLGGSLAASARLRYVMYKNGGKNGY